VIDQGLTHWKSAHDEGNSVDTKWVYPSGETGSIERESWSGVDASGP
jgi:hypothetical protein